MDTITTETLGERSDIMAITKPTSWRIGTVVSILSEAPGLRSYTFRFEDKVQHDAGQHYEIRLTAEDGYQAARLYSAAMPANGTSNTLQLTLALMPSGEVSPYIFSDVNVGDQLEIRGPFGGHFVWNSTIRRPILLVGGGTGIIPLRAIRLSHQQCCADEDIQLLYSVKSYDDMAYKYELFPRNGTPADDITITFTGPPPKGWKGHTGRINETMLEQALYSFSTPPITYVCGPTPMVESITQMLVRIGQDEDDIKAERFGPAS